MPYDNAKQSVDGTRFKDAVGRFASGVTVLTVCDDDEKLSGITVSAFCSLSLEPPLVLACVNYGSDCYQQLRNVGRFAAHILSERQTDLALAFARPDNTMTHEVEWRRSTLGNALLDGCLGVIECRLTHNYVGGDHAIIVGAVESISLDPDPDPPLLYYRGQLNPFTAKN